MDIVGAGPSGLALAWYISRDTAVSVRVFEAKSTPGGSWAEPSERRDLHAVRAVFPQSFVNTQALLRDMQLEWDDFFTSPASRSGEKTDTAAEVWDNNTNPNSRLGNSFTPVDVMRLAAAFVGCLCWPQAYKRRTLGEQFGHMSPSGRRALRALAYVFDGVSWDTMTAYEFLETINFVGIGRMQVLNGSGAKLGRQMVDAIRRERSNVAFHFDRRVSGIWMGTRRSRSSGHTLSFSGDATRVEGDDLVLCVDASSLPGLINAMVPRPRPNSVLALTKRTAAGAYHAITVVFEYARDVYLPESEVATALNTDWTLVAQRLEDSAAPLTMVACTIVNLDTRSRRTHKSARQTPEAELVTEVLRQLRLPPPASARVCQGSTWNEQHQAWTFLQSSGVITQHGPVAEGIAFGLGQARVLICSTLNDRATPFASLEGAIEVAASLCMRRFPDARGGLRVRRPWRIGDLALVGAVCLVMCLAVIAFVEVSR